MMSCYPCLLCESGDTTLWFTKEEASYGIRDFYLCQECGLLFADPKTRLDRAAEKDRYDQHNNLPDDLEYLNFLRKLADPLSKCLKEGAVGLDYGCGPACVIGKVINLREVHVSYYDPFYYPDKALLRKEYNFITCSEASEHFFNPQKEFTQLNDLLKKGGHLGVMTNMFDEEMDIKNWWYIKDPTHVSFYQERTFNWIARKMGWVVEFPAENVAVFTKSL